MLAALRNVLVKHKFQRIFHGLGLIYFLEPYDEIVANFYQLGYLLCALSFLAFLAIKDLFLRR